MTDTLSQLPPILFVPVFLGFWLVISWFISLAAWAPLARFFPADVGRLSEPEQTFSMQSAAMKRNGQLTVSYSNVLMVGLNLAGMRLKVLFPFRFQHPPLFIPWAATTPITTESRLWGLVKEHRFNVQLPDGQQVAVKLASTRLAGTIAGYQAAAA